MKTERRIWILNRRLWLNPRDKPTALTIPFQTALPRRFLGKLRFCKGQGACLRRPEQGGKTLSPAEDWRRAECPRHRWSGHSARDQMGSRAFSGWARINLIFPARVRMSEPLSSLRCLSECVTLKLRRIIRAFANFARQGDPNRAPWRREHHFSQRKATRRDQSRSVVECPFCQRMKIIHLFTLCTVVLFGACSEKRSVPASTKGGVDRHADAIYEFQKAQQRFKDLVATVRDETSYDQAAFDLERVVRDFRQVTVTLKELSPPAEAARKKYRQMIADGHRSTEPTGEDMLSIVSIESREKEVTAWLESLVAAGQEAGVEMARLYGETDEALDAKVPRQLNQNDGSTAPGAATKELEQDASGRPPPAPLPR